MPSTTNKRRTLAKLLNRYIREYSTRKAKTTLRDEKCYARFLKNEFKRMYIDEITSDFLASKVLGWRNAKGKRTFNRNLALLSSAFDKGMQIWGWCDHNPVKFIPREKEVQRVMFFPDHDFEIIFKALPSWLKPIILVAKNTGLRLANVAFLRWEQVELEQKFITILDKEMKNNRSLGIPLNNIVSNVLNHLSKNKKGKFVFCWQNGKPYTRWGISQRFKKTCVEVNLQKYRFHDLRHDFCSQLVQKGANLFKVKELAGHKDIASTQRYAHLRREDLRSDVELLNSDNPLYLYPEENGV